MRAHLFDNLRAPQGKSYENLIYGTLLVVGVPVAVVGARYIIQTLFSLLT
jgi:hypothetical protein